MVEKIAIIENKDQAKVFLKNKEQFKDYLPVTFSYEAEEILLKSGVRFKMDDDYETEGIYEGLYKISLGITNKISKEIKFYYRKIELFELFYQNLLIFIGNNLRHLKILEKIENDENPKKVLIFQRIKKNPEKEICSELANKFFGDKKETRNYVIDNEKGVKEKLISFGGLIQKKISDVFLSFKKRKGIILFDEGKHRGEFLLRELGKNKEICLLRCHSRLQKGFFIKKRYLHFYQFFGKRNEQGKKLNLKINKFLIDKKNFSFLKKLGLNKLVLSQIESLIKYYFSNKFLEVSFTINHLIDFVQKYKIKAIIVFADTPTFEKILVKTGKLFKIPTFVLQHGSVGYELGFFPFSADYFIAFGEESKYRLKKFGIPEEKIFVLGHPQFERYSDINLEKKNKIVYVSSDANSTNFLPEVDPSKKMQKDILRIIFKTMKNFPNYKLVIRKRGKDWDMYNLSKQIAREENFKNLEIVDGKNLINLFKDSKITLINNSTLALDSWISKNKVISITFKELVNFFESPLTKSLKKVFNEKELERAISKTLKNKEDPEEFLKNRLTNKENASKKIAEFIFEKISLIRKEFK